MPRIDPLKQMQYAINNLLRSHALNLRKGPRIEACRLNPGVVSIAMSESNRWYVALSSGALRNFKMDYEILRPKLQHLLSPIINVEICIPQKRPPILGPKEERFQDKPWVGAEHNPACAEKHLAYEALTKRDEKLLFMSNSAFPLIESPAPILQSYRGKAHSDGFVPICPCQSCSAILAENNIEFLSKEYDIDRFATNEAGVWVLK